MSFLVVSFLGLKSPKISIYLWLLDCIICLQYRKKDFKSGMLLTIKPSIPILISYSQLLMDLVLLSEMALLDIVARMAANCTVVSKDDKMLLLVLITIQPSYVHIIPVSLAITLTSLHFIFPLLVTSNIQ